MTKQELAIAVAEQVWGMKTLNEEGVIGWRDDSIVGITLIGLMQEVFSWQGFGRTVEAMAERKLYCENSLFGSNVHAPYTVYFTTESGFHKGEADYIPADPKSLIEATHKAALEALKDE